MKKGNWLVLSLTLLFGILIGASSTTIYYEGIIKDLASLSRHVPQAEELLVRLDNYCDLDDEQEKIIIAILRKHKKQLDAIRQNHEEAMASIRQSFEKSLEPYLTPDQKKKVRAILTPPKPAAVPAKNSMD